MTDNNAVIKIVAKHTKEYNELNEKYVKLGRKVLWKNKIYAEVLDEKTTVDALCTKLRKDNAELRKLNGEAKKECRTLQESLDQCQQEIEKLYERIGELGGDD